MDEFNLYDLSQHFTYYNEALMLITELEDADSDNDLRKKDIEI